MRLAAALFALAFSAVFAPVLAATTADYHITKTVVLGAPDGWDYLVFDPVLNRVYVSHRDKVTVVDATSRLGWVAS